MVNTTEAPVKKNRLKTVAKSTFRVFAVIILIILAFSGWQAYRFSSFFSGSYVDFLRSSEPLERDRYGRSNVLLFGTSEDVPGSHAPLLADSIIVVSIDQDSRQGNIISIPRDLWVEYDRECPGGNKGKINAVYACGLRDGLNEASASELFADKVGYVIGTDIQYVMKVNHTVLKEVVDTLGGIEVIIDSPDPRGIYDAATGLKLPNGPSVIDGQTALDLSRARGWRGSYGLPGYVFSREQNQEKVIRGIQEKALTYEGFEDSAAAISFLFSLSGNVVTNVPARQVETFVDVARNTNANDIQDINLFEADNSLVTTDEKAGQSIVLPAAGLYKYSQIHETIQASFL